MTKCSFSTRIRPSAPAGRDETGAFRKELRFSAEASNGNNSGAAESEPLGEEGTGGTGGLAESEADSRSWNAKRNAAYPENERKECFLFMAKMGLGVKSMESETAQNGDFLMSIEGFETTGQSPVKPFDDVSPYLKSPLG